MFENLGWPEIAALLLIALFVIGPERLPKVLSQLGKGLRKLRDMASTATADISKEVGTDINITDLHPKTFIRKHVLSEADEDALKKPLQTAINDLKGHTKPLQDELDKTASAIKSKPTRRNGSPAAKSDTGSSEEAGTSGESGTGTRRFDDDAT